MIWGGREADCVIYVVKMCAVLPVSTKIRALIQAVTVLASSFGALGAVAAPVVLDPNLAHQRGAPINQRFLPSGASILTTLDAKACVVSRRINIETSIYRNSDGSAAAFDEIRRSPAASVQAIAAAGAPAFRMQLKYSVIPGTPIRLTLGGRELDLQTALERSTDSLLIAGAEAAALEAAFRAGERPVLEAVSVDTGRHVIDRLDAPDLAALAECQTVLPTDRLTEGLVSNEVRVTFQADPETTPLATLPDLKACGMTEPPGRLHLTRLETITGFFAQTDKVFVAFDEAGALSQAYIPGIFDGDFRNGAQKARLSRASDGNVPMAANDVKGCLGAEAIEICDYRSKNGGHMLGSCLHPDALAMEAPSGVPGNVGPREPIGIAGLPAGPSGSPGGGLINVATTGPGGGGGSSSSDDGGEGGGTPPVPPDGDPSTPSPVPLPASVFLLSGALLGLRGLRRRGKAKRT